MIGDLADLQLLTSRNDFCGFAVSDILREMGFNLKFFLYGSGLKTADHRPTPKNLRAFSSGLQLEQLLSEEKSALAFSSFSHDPRLIRRGIHSFSENAFAPGMEGFLRSAGMLLSMAENVPFTNQRHLLRPAG